PPLFRSSWSSSGMFWFRKPVTSPSSQRPRAILARTSASSLSLPGWEAMPAQPARPASTTIITIKRIEYLQIVIAAVPASGSSPDYLPGPAGPARANRPRHQPRQSSPSTASTISTLSWQLCPPADPALIICPAQQAQPAGQGRFGIRPGLQLRVDLHRLSWAPARVPAQSQRSPLILQAQQQPAIGLIQLGRQVSEGHGLGQATSRLLPDQPAPGTGYVLQILQRQLGYIQQPFPAEGEGRIVDDRHAGCIQFAADVVQAQGTGADAQLPQHLTVARLPLQLQTYGAAQQHSGTPAPVQTALIDAIHHQLTGLAGPECAGQAMNGHRHRQTRLQLFPDHRGGQCPDEGQQIQQQTADQGFLQVPANPHQRGSTLIRAVTVPGALPASTAS